MIVSWSDKAKFRLREIYEHIAKDSPIRARQVIDRLTHRSVALSQLPRIDRPVPEYPHDHLREVLDRPFRLIYLIGEGRIDIVSVKQYRQRLPENPADL